MSHFASVSRFVSMLTIPVLVVAACSDDKVDSPATGPTADAGATGPAADASADVATVDGGSDAGAGSDSASDSATTDSGADAGQHLAQQLVGADGGTVTASNGVKLEIPAGALPGDVTLTIDEVADVPPPAGATALGKTFQIGPEGQTFTTPVKVTLPWNGGDVPVVIAHAQRGSTTWTTLDQGDATATHVTGYTRGFSWFRPVYYQGAPDAPIVLENEEPLSPKAVELKTSREAFLRGTGFRTDTVVTLFKDGVPTANATGVKLGYYGLEFVVPAAFTDTVGLITVQAKNPMAQVGDATAMYAIEKPMVSNFSPTSATSKSDGAGRHPLTPSFFSAKATKLPNDLSLCRVIVSVVVSPTLGAGVETTGLTFNDGGFSFSVPESPFTGKHDVHLNCGGVRANEVSFTVTRAN